MGMEDLQRTLGRLEGKIDLVLSEQAHVRGDLLDHKGQDKNDFAIVSARFGGVSKRLDEAADRQVKMFEEQNEKLDSLNEYVNRVKGAWWLIGVLVIIIAGAGAALDWILSWLRHPHGGL